tara:strand:- start:5060 stop:5320 length:261 start_codon:yes stop_codon:yes gene_type:complete
MVLIDFYGTECHHCIEMEPLIKKLEKEEKVKVKRLEVWHNAANDKKREELDEGFCGGVPLFVNTETGKKICGSTSYANLKKWALGK